MKLKIIAWITFIMSFSWYFVLRNKIPQKYSNSPKGFQFPKFVFFAVKYSKVGHPELNCLYVTRYVMGEAGSGTAGREGEGVH